MNFRVSEDICALCNVVQNAASNLTATVLLVNSLSQCGHKFCRSCADIQFSRKRQFSCPVCGGIVKASTLTEKSLHEIEVNEDYKIRKKINDIYNLSEKDFATLREFCDYQEMVEDLVYDLTNKVNVEEAERRIAAYQAENNERIQLKQAQLAEQERRMARLIKTEKEQRVDLQLSLQELDRREREDKRELKRQTAEVMLGERDKVSAHLSEAMDQSGRRRRQEPFSRLMDGFATGSAQALGAAEPANPVLTGSHVNTMLEQYMQRRPLPRVLKQERAGDGAAKNSAGVAAAGGYRPDVHLRRCWAEALSSTEAYLRDVGAINPIAETTFLSVMSSSQRA